MTQSPEHESIGERVVTSLMLVVFWAAFASLSVGLTLWVPDHGSAPAGLLLPAGLLGLMLLPILRLVATIAAAHRQRDWLMLASTLAVLTILFALTLRDATGLK